jgi:hypothetical protein
LYAWDGQAVHDGWTYVHVAATKSAAAVRRTWAFVCQLQTAAVRQGRTSVYELQPLGLHNKFTKLYKVHKNFKKFFIFLVILRIDFFENL